MITYQAPVKVLDVYYVLPSQFYKMDSIVPTSQARKLRNEEVPLLVKGQDGAAGIQTTTVGLRVGRRAPSHAECLQTSQHQDCTCFRIEIALCYVSPRHGHFFFDQ